MKKKIFIPEIGWLYEITIYRTNKDNIKEPFLEYQLIETNKKK
jgi:hypothetical protein